MLEYDTTGHGAVQPRDGAHQRRLSRSVRTQDRDHFPAADPEIDLLQYWFGAIAGAQAAYFQQRLARRGALGAEATTPLPEVRLFHGGGASAPTAPSATGSPN